MLQPTLFLAYHRPPSSERWGLPPGWPNSEEGEMAGPGSPLSTKAEAEIYSCGCKVCALRSLEHGRKRWMGSAMKSAVTCRRLIGAAIGDASMRKKLSRPEDAKELRKLRQEKQEQVQAKQRALEEAWGED
eukprot:scaffold975_cov398-Prasinococcus_capsulatus_cf.AAC.3